MRSSSRYYLTPDEGRKCQDNGHPEATDPEGFTAYSRRVPESIARHGGRYLARGGAVERPEGEWNPKRVVLIEFPNAERAGAWWSSPEYEGLKRLRVGRAVVSRVVVAGPGTTTP